MDDWQVNGLLVFFGAMVSLIAYELRDANKKLQRISELLAQRKKDYDL